MVTADQCELFHATRTMSMDGSTIMLKVNTTTQFKTFKAGSTSQDGTCEQGNFIHNGKSYKKVFVIANYAVTLVETKIVFSRESGYAGGAYAGCHVHARSCENQGMRLVYKAPEEACELMKLKSFNAELLHGYLYDMGTKFEKFVPPKETDRKFREAETERVSMIETPTVVLSQKDGIILIRKTPIIKCSTNLWTTNYPNLFL